MNIIPKTRTANGAYDNIQKGWAAPLPDTHYEVAEGVTLPNGGFGTSVFTGDIITEFIADEAAWDAYKASIKPQEDAKAKAEQIAELTSQLSATDYKAIKYSEGWITEADYAPIKAERQAIRDQINALEESAS